MNKKTGNLHLKSALRKASTVILVRDNEQGQLEVYLLRRSQQSSFMPGLYVFPGGSLEPWDENPGLPENGWDQPLAMVLERLGQGLTPRQAMAHLLAAMRETFEEVGVLLAEERGWETQSSLPEKFTMETRCFKDVLLGQDTRLQASRFSTWAHWITPEAMPMRFDTRFYLALHPQGQICMPDQVETTHGLWIRPMDAVLGNYEARIPLSPPALVSLQELSQFRNLKELRIKAWDRGWGSPRIPRAFRSPSGPMLLMPWDQDYSSEDPGRGMHNSCIEYANPLEPFSRLIWQDGIWRAVLP